MSLAEADWVVQDSEEEDTLDTDVVYDLTRPLAPSAASSVQHAINSIRSAVSSIESPAFATSPRTPQQTAADTSLISSFTGKVPQHSAGPSTVSVSSTILDTNAPGKSRPKPRPRFKGAAPPLNGANATSSSSIDNSSSLLRTDPADSIRTSTGASAYDGDGIGSFSIADRAKMRSRTNTAVKSAQSAAVTPSSSTSASARKKVKTPPITMEVIEITSEEDDELDPMSLFTPRKKKSNDTRPNKRSSPLSKSNVSKRAKLSQPAPTSTSTLPPSSVLPPSDPPTSTLARTTTPDLDLPPIATLMVDLTPPQSPVIRKRKRTPPARASALGWQDEGTGEEEVMESDVDLDARKMPPPQHQASPPTFFAASSSSSVDMLDDSGVGLHPEPASKKTKKKAARPKPKPKPKKTGKKTGVNEGQVAVVVEIKANGTGKGKGKEKEVFKSKEFIDDDDDDEAVVGQAAPSVSVPLPPAETMTVPESDLSAISDSELEGTVALQRPGKNGKATKKKTIKKVTPRSSKDAPKVENEAEDVVKGPAKRKGKGKVILSDDEDQDQVDEAVFPAPAPSGGGKRGKEKKKPKVGKTHDAEESDREPGKSDGADDAVKAIKENLRPDNGSSSKPSPTKADTPGPSVSRSFSIASRASTRSTPMSELIRRVNSIPGSPFGASRASSSGIYSPYAKSSRTSLMRIAPLHPNRRTPPPPLPRPPPPKKTKKQLMLEEKWEEELAETVEGWACLTDEERAGLRRAKREREMGGYED